LKTIDVPARDNPCWNDHDWRFTTLRECVKAHNLTKYDLADLTGVKPVTARFWINGNYPIGVQTLRALILDLNAGRRVA